MDEELAPDVAAVGPRPIVTNTIMNSLQDRVELARAVLSAGQTAN